MKILVTGGSGFIGKHLAARLARTDHTVRCLVRSPERGTLLTNFGVELALGDVTRSETLTEALRGMDCVIHLANVYTMWTPKPEEMWKVNVEGTRNLMEAAAQAGVGKVVYVSTVAVYGQPADKPFHEDSVPGPKFFSTYARTKAEGDRIAWEYHQKRGLPLTVLYPGIVLGAGDEKASGEYIMDVIRRRVPSTIYHRSYATYVHVGDVVEAILRAAETPASVGRKYLIGKTVLNGKDYAAMIGAAADVRLPLIPFPDFVVTAAAYLQTWAAAVTHQPPRWGLSIDAAKTLKNGFAFDGSRAERELGLRYTPIRQALAEAVAWYRERWAAGE